MIVVIDNYDSFTYNLVQYFGELGCDITVFRHDAVTVAEVLALSPKGIVISPGPGRPEDAGISMDLIRECYQDIPILGVCLGHQSIAQVFGAKITYAPDIVHGKTSPIYHDGKTVYQGVESPFDATRYHSLIVDRDTLPDTLDVSSWTEDGLIMGIRHRTYPVEGIQFHPESILTKVGLTLLKGFLYSVKNGS